MPASIFVLRMFVGASCTQKLRALQSPCVFLLPCAPCNPFRLAPDVCFERGWRAWFSRVRVNAPGTLRVHLFHSQCGTGQSSDYRFVDLCCRLFTLLLALLLWNRKKACPRTEALRALASTCSPETDSCAHRRCASFMRACTAAFALAAAAAACAHGPERYATLAVVCSLWRSGSGLPRPLRGSRACSPT